MNGAPRSLRNRSRERRPEDNFLFSTITRLRTETLLAPEWRPYADLRRDERPPGQNNSNWKGDVCSGLASRQPTATKAQAQFGDDQLARSCSSLFELCDRDRPIDRLALPAGATLRRCRLARRRHESRLSM
jgi:hypothetical protein